MYFYLFILFFFLMRRKWNLRDPWKKTQREKCLKFRLGRQMKQTKQSNTYYSLEILWLNFVLIFVRIVRVNKTINERWEKHTTREIILWQIIYCIANTWCITYIVWEIDSKYCRQREKWKMKECSYTEMN